MIPLYFYDTVLHYQDFIPTIHQIVLMKYKPVPLHQFPFLCKERLPQSLQGQLCPQTGFLPMSGEHTLSVFTAKLLTHLPQYLCAPATSHPSLFHPSMLQACSELLLIDNQLLSFLTDLLMPDAPILTHLYVAGASLIFRFCKSQEVPNII